MASESVNQTGSASPDTGDRSSVEEDAVVTGSTVEEASFSQRAAAWVFGLYVAVAGPLLVFKLGSFFWFFRDDWVFITDRQLDSADDLFRAHNGHWSTVPLIAFRALYAVFGVRTYVPYQAVVVALHLGVVVLLRVVMRRAGVGPWLATAVAGSLVLFGPGREDILWAFQIGFTGATFWGLCCLLLADHKGRFGWRDVLALGAGLLSVMSTAPGIVMVSVVGLVLLVRHGWKRAARQTVPLGAIWLTWYLIEKPALSTPFGRPDLGTVWRWVRSGQIGTFMDLGHWSVVAWLLVAVLIAGLGLLLVPTVLRVDGASGSGRWERLQAVAAPLALFVGSFVFMVLTAETRWFAGPQAARAGRYVYFAAVLTLPILAVAAQEIARRWRWTTPALALLVLVSLPLNIAAFDDSPFGPDYHQERKDILTTVVRMPFAREVSPTVRPIPDVFLSDGLDMAYLLQAAKSGKLDPSTGPIPAKLRNELTVMLSFSQAPGEGLPSSCRWLKPGQLIRAPKGTEFLWLGQRPLRIRLAGAAKFPWVQFKPGDGQLFTLERRVALAWKGGKGDRLCRIP